LYEEGTGLKSIAALSRTSRNSVKKYIRKRHSLDISYEEFRQRSDSDLYEVFFITGSSSASLPHMEELEAMMPDICKELGKKGMTTLKQLDKYREIHPEGYGLTPFRSGSRCKSSQTQRQGLGRKRSQVNL